MTEPCTRSWPPWSGWALPPTRAREGRAYGPYVQSERLPIYQAAAEWLLEQGYAYRCFCTPERLEAMRLAQQAVGGTPMYDRHCRNLDPEVARRRAEAGEQCVIRLIVPDEAEFRFQDPLRGEIVFDSRQVDDQVLLKSDGFPTYHLAVVVDDHFMRVTTAIRGEEWISSTPKHLLLYRYFGWEMPRIVHTPLLRDASRRKLSSVPAILHRGIATRVTSPRGSATSSPASSGPTPRKRTSTPTRST